MNNIDLVPLFAKIMDVKNVPTDGTLERVQLLLENDNNSSSAIGNTGVLAATVVIMIAVAHVLFI